MKRERKVKLDRNGLAPCNGRPQLYHSLGIDPLLDFNRLRIVYPSGRVEYCLGDNTWQRGCTSRRSQEEALKAMVEYSELWDMDTVFLGYL